MAQSSQAQSVHLRSIQTLRRYVNRYTLSAAAVFVFILAIGSSIYFYTQYHKTKDQLAKPASAAQASTADLVKKIGSHLQLPAGEQPTVASVSDVSKLSSQTFFKNAKNGDRVLIYSQAKEAILYRPSTDKIINVAPLNTTAATP